MLENETLLIIILLFSIGPASPQILYQRPYDPVVVPIQSQQIAIAQSPTIALSQPAYAPQRIIQGPTLFRNALAKVSHFQYVS